MNSYRRTWELYTEAWKQITLSERVNLFRQSLAPDCCYADPLAVAQGWDALTAYIEEFHRQVPSGHFEIVEFMTHHDSSFAKWNMLNHEGIKIGDGYSFGEYNQKGLLVKMTGYYKVG